MPQLARHLDGIARSRGADILFIRHLRVAEPPWTGSWERCRERRRRIRFLDAHRIPRDGLARFLIFALALFRP